MKNKKERRTMKEQELELKIRQEEYLVGYIYEIKSA